MGNTVDTEAQPETDAEDGEREYEVKLAATCFMAVGGVECFHTSIIVDDNEYFFDSLGIMVAPPLWSHLQAQAKGAPQLETIDYGTTTLSGKGMAEALRPHFGKNSYDLLYKNCNHFSDCALYCLNGSRLTGRINRIERMLACTSPVSTNLMNSMFRYLIERRTGEPCESDIYVTNPLAKDFLTAEVIEELDEANADSEEEDDDDGTIVIGCARITPPPCCSRAVSTRLQG